MYFLSFIIKVICNFIKKEKKREANVFLMACCKKFHWNLIVPPIMFRPVLWVKGGFAYRVMAKKKREMWFEVFECF